jgi:ubiquinone/menaquinone biosynthesis C-methylase UbiE
VLQIATQKEKKMDIQAFNRTARDKEVENDNPFTRPISREVIAAARQGEWTFYLTNTKPVPQDWFPNLRGCDVLCLASGGGQQGPLFAAVGANVTVFDISSNQLAQDRYVAERDRLEIKTVEGDMADLSVFSDHQFDLIIHPVSNLFVPDVHPVWAEAYRVLRPHGILLAAFMNPTEYIFDIYRLDHEEELEVKHPLPFSSLSSLTEEERERYFGLDAPIEFSHTLEDQIGGQLKAGFILTGFYEDRRPDELIGKYIPSTFATKAIKP